ncbi:MAG: GldG family protein [Betaproteobacteria bacterium]
MKKNNLTDLFYSAGGLILLGLILIAGNFLLGTFKFRADLTQGSVYTLSEGTKAILSKLEAPVTIRYYYTQGSNVVPVALKTYAKRVEDLLAEYTSASNGKVIVEKFNPEPDSDAEESAELDNVEGQQTDTGEKFYLGLSIAFLDKKESIGVLSGDREQLLEYDLTSKISQVTRAKKPVIGLMAGLPVLGQPLDPMTKKQPTLPWVLGAELKKMFDIRKLELSAKKIDDDIKVLLVIHPKNITEEAEYAIDQFVLRGGKLIAFVDPYSYFDQQPDMQNPFGGNQAGSSTLYNLFKGWGVELDGGKVIADMTFPSGAGPRLLPTLLMLNNEAFNMNDVVMSKVGTMLVPFAGTFKGKLADGLKQSPLIHTSKNAMPVDLIIATLTGEPSTKGFQPSGKEEPIAVRITGKFKSAFPNGEPVAPQAPAKKGEPIQPPPPASGQHMRQSLVENSVVLVADVDMLTDGAALETQDVFGQKVVVPRNGNLAFAQSLVEQLSGDQNLMNLRSRASFTKPLTVLRNMEAQAQQVYLGKIKTLEDGLNATTEKLQALQKGRGAAAGAAKAPTVLTPEQQLEIERFRKQSNETRKELKSLRKNLRVDSDRLELWTKVINIGLIPVLVAILGLGFALSKRRKLRAAVTA